MKKTICILIASLALAGCGRRGPLVAPDAAIPAAVDSLKVSQKDNRFYLSWAPPLRDLAGKPLQGLAGFRLLRRQVLPPGQDCEECADAYRTVKTVDLDILKEARRFNDLYVVTDTGLVPGNTYQYRVVSFKKDGTESARSNPARRTLLPSPAAPVLRATPVADGIDLQWELPGGGAQPSGYNLYRRNKGDINSLTILNGAPVKDARFEDRGAEKGVTYLYSVRGVVTTGDVPLEGALSNEVEGRWAGGQ